MLPLMLSGINRHRRTNLYDCTYEAPRVVALYYRHRKQNSGCPGLGGEGSEGLVFDGDRVPVWEDGRALETEGGDSCPPA